MLHEVNAIKILENKTGLSSCKGQYLNLVGFCWMVYGKCPLYTILKTHCFALKNLRKRCDENNNRWTTSVYLRKICWASVEYSMRT